MHSKSHSAPDKTSLANFAKYRPDSGSEPRTKLDVKGSRLFADAKAAITKKRKLVYSSPKVPNSSEPVTKKTKVTKKQRETKKESD